MPQAGLSEDEAIDLVMVSLLNAFERRRYEAAGVDRTHLAKAIFRLADEFQLPITRCWFKFGQFVLSPRAGPDHLMRLRVTGPGGLSARLTGDLRPTFLALQKSAERLVLFFSRPLDIFLPTYYEKEAPPEFREVYASNFEWISFGQGLTRADDLRGGRTFFTENARKHLNRLHKAAAPVMKNPDSRALVLEYSSFLEQLVIRLDRLMADATFDLESWKAYFSTALDVYMDYIWTLPAAQIAAETMVGSSAVEEREQMLRTAALANRYRTDQVEPVVALAESRGYLPTEQDLADALAAARERAGSRAEGIEELAYLARKEG